MQLSNHINYPATFLAENLNEHAAKRQWRGDASSEVTEDRSSLTFSVYPTWNHLANTLKSISYFEYDGVFL
jgi:hypothetical protein